MGWEIGANLGRHARTGVDARGWLWEITRGARVAQVVVEIGGPAWSSDLWTCRSIRGRLSRPTAERSCSRSSTKTSRPP
jgi:hypothetical protein